MEKTTKKRVKNVILGVTSAALVAGLTSALTLAMLSDVSSKENTFTASPSLSLTLYEPKWDGTNWGSNSKESYNYDSEGGVNKGEDDAREYVPDTAINKNPFVVNDSKSDVYVAFAVTYQVRCDGGSPLAPNDGTLCGSSNWHTISPSDFRNYFASTNYGDKDYNSDDFDKELVVVDPKNPSTYVEYYYYMDKSANRFTRLSPGQSTSELFKSVTPNKSLDDLDELGTGNEHMFKCNAENTCGHNNHYDYSLVDVESGNVFILVGNQAGLPEFRINVVAAAVQAEHIGLDGDVFTVDQIGEIKAALKKCFPSVTNKDQMLN